MSPRFPGLPGTHVPHVSRETGRFNVSTSLRVPEFRSDTCCKINNQTILGISLTVKLVIPCPVMATPLFLFLCEGVAEAHARATPRDVLTITNQVVQVL